MGDDICHYKLGLETHLGRLYAIPRDNPFFQLGVEDGRNLLRTNRYAKIPLRCVACTQNCPDLYESPSQFDMKTFNSLEDVFAGSLLGVGIGDAMGVPIEGLSKKELVEEFGYIQGFIGTIRFPKGTYSDDTDLTLIVAQSLDEKGYFYRQIFRKKVLEWLGTNARSPGRGIKRAAIYFSGNSHENSSRTNYGNGAAIRLVPVVLVNYNNEKLLESEIIKMVQETHDNDISVAATTSLARLISYAVKHTAETFDRFEIADTLVRKSNEISKEFSNILNFAFSSFQKNFDSVVKKIGTGVLAKESVAAALYIAIRQYKDFRRAILSSINSGGDSDSIGSMVGAVSGALHGAKKIPHHWIDQLENQDFIIQTALDLHRKMLCRDEL